MAQMSLDEAIARCQCEVRLVATTRENTTSAWLLNQSLVFNLPGHPTSGYILFHAMI